MAGSIFFKVNTMKAYKKILITIFTVVVIISAFCLSACNNNKPDDVSGKPVMVVLGDSIAAGSNSDFLVEDHSAPYPSSSEGCGGAIAGNCAGYDTIVYAVGGYTTTTMLTLIQNDKSVRNTIAKADIVYSHIIHNDLYVENANNLSAIVGGNYNYLTPIIAKAKLNIGKIVTEIKSLNSDAKIIFQGVNGRWGSGFGREIDEIDKRLNTAFTGYLEENDGAFYYLEPYELPEDGFDSTGDTLHPNDVGYMCISLDIFEGLKKWELLKVTEAEYIKNYREYTKKLIKKNVEVQDTAFNFDGFNVLLNDAQTLDEIFTLYQGAANAVNGELLVLLGDSIASGANASTLILGSSSEEYDYNWPVLTLGACTAVTMIPSGMNYINHAIGGYTSETVLALVKNNQTVRNNIAKADYVYMSFLGNDAFLDSHYNDILAGDTRYLANIINKARSNFNKIMEQVNALNPDAKVVCQALVGAPFDALTSVFTGYEKDNPGSLTVANVPDVPLDSKDYPAGDFHPNDTGHAKLAIGYYEAIKQAGVPLVAESVYVENLKPYFAFMLKRYEKATGKQCDIDGYHSAVAALTSASDVLDAYVNAIYNAE